MAHPNMFRFVEFFEREVRSAEFLGCLNASLAEPVDAKALQEIVQEILQLLQQNVVEFMPRNWEHRSKEHQERYVQEVAREVLHHLKNPNTPYVPADEVADEYEEMLEEMSLLEFSMLSVDSDEELERGLVEVEKEESVRIVYQKLVMKVMRYSKKTAGAA